MKQLSGHEIRKMWLDYFAKKHDHAIEESASLIPINDPTLLWINAGVAALKGYFDGSKIPENPRMVNAQKCIRTNDIENVGKTARHHTFFEMLGNFSIGDYFRDEVIPWAYELLTDEKYYGFDKKKLYFTVYPDDEATKEQWIKAGVDPSHIIKSEHNYWEIGPGPCGPCTEIFYDRGSAFGEGDLTLIEQDIENDRYIEIWNIVFSQFNAKPGLKREEYPELPSKNIDTGMGLERMACVMQQKETNFETDLFYPIIKHVSRIANKPYDGSMSFKVIADHMRTVVFAVSDGATLSNEGRGYVLRRLLRRAVKHGRQLGIEKPFLKDLVDTVIKMMEDGYPSLNKTASFVKQVIEKEEQKFLETLNQGEKILESLLASDDDVLDGKDAFTLYDTYGFPLELTEEYAEQQGKRVDKEGFDEAMQAQRDRARSARKVKSSMKDQNEAYLNFKAPSKFIGYETTETEAKVIKVFNEGIVVDQTPFYAESGGQVSDSGTIEKAGNAYEVIDVEKLPNGQFLHLLDAHDIEENDRVTMRVDTHKREQTKAHHSVTHLLYQTLRETYGAHVHQQGSLVGPEYLRFDFSHVSLPSDKELLTIEKAVNEKIRQNIDVDIDYTDLDTAKSRGAIAEFGEKYESTVRVVNMGGTIDLCGGTHVDNTEEIERFAIASVESKGSGIYRIVALAKDRVYDIEQFTKGVDDNIRHLESKAHQILQASRKEAIKLDATLPEKETIRGSYQDIINKRNHLESLQKAVKSLEKTFEQKRRESTLENLDQYMKHAQNGRLVLKTHDLDAKTVKSLADRLMDKIGKGIVFIANTDEDKLLLVAKSKSDIHAGDLVKNAAKIAGGGGGGRPDFAQAGAKDTSKIDDVISFAKRFGA